MITLSVCWRNIHWLMEENNLEKNEMPLWAVKNWSHLEKIWTVINDHMKIDYLFGK